MKKAIIILLVLALAFCSIACGTKEKEEAASTSIAVCVGSEPDTIDPALNSAVDGATLIIHAFSGLIGWAQNDEGVLELVAECAKEIPEPTINADGTVTYVFELKDGLKWSDGSDLTMADFEFAWKRAASVELAADYGYMFDVIDGYAEYTAADDDGVRTNPDAELNVTASEDGKTLTVVLSSNVPYFMELCAFPTYMPVKEDVVANENWATDPSTYVCNGAYKMTEWTHSGKIVYEKNPDFFNADKITMDKIEFYLSDDDGAQLANFKSGEWLFIDSVPNEEIATLKVDYPDEFVVAGQLGTYYTCFNINKDLLPATSELTGVEKEAAEVEIRQALALLIDRNYVVEEIGQAGQVPASSFVAMGLMEPDGSEFCENAGDFAANGYYGYFNTAKEAFEANVANALETLKKYYTYDEATGKLTDFPTIDYLYNTSSGHQAIGEYIQQAFAVYGINMTLTNQEWATFLNTRKDGDYTFARNGWLGDYNDPISFLDMWITASGNNDVQFGKGTHTNVAMYSIDLTGIEGYDTVVENGTWAQTYDVIIAAVKAESDPAKRFALMHEAEDLLMSTGCIVPIYYYTDIYMCSAHVDGFFSSPLGYKYFMYATVAE